MKLHYNNYMQSRMQEVNHEFMEKTYSKETLHMKMLLQYKNYHVTAQKSKGFSLLQTLQVFSKFVTRDEFLHKVVNDEINLLEKNNCKNPYWIDIDSE